jgi:hypothetical protein
MTQHTDTETIWVTQEAFDRLKQELAHLKNDVMDEITAKLYGYEVVDAHHVKVTLEVRRPDPVRVRCTVYAQSIDHDIVGERTVDLPAGTREKTRYPLTVETERKAVAGVLRMCESLD